jgi:hypothetical protein
MEKSNSILAPYIQVGKRKYLLMEVEEVSKDNGFQVTDL